MAMGSPQETAFEDLPTDVCDIIWEMVGDLPLLYRLCQDSRSYVIHVVEQGACSSLRQAFIIGRSELAKYWLSLPAKKNSLAMAADYKWCAREGHSDLFFAIVEAAGTDHIELAMEDTCEFSPKYTQRNNQLNAHELAALDRDVYTQKISILKCILSHGRPKHTRTVTDAMYAACASPLPPPAETDLEGPNITTEDQTFVPESTTYREQPPLFVEILLHTDFFTVDPRTLWNGLLIAASSPSIPVFEYLVRLPALEDFVLNHSDNRSMANHLFRTVLQHEVPNTSVRLVRITMADSKMFDEQLLGWLPLYVVSSANDWNCSEDALRFILSHCVTDPNSHDAVSLRTACKNGRVDIVKALLLDGRADPAAKQSESLRMACEKGDVAIVELLLRDGRVDPSTMNNFCIRIATMKGHEQVLRLLLNTGKVDVTSQKEFVRRWSAQEGKEEIAKLLFGVS